MSDERHSAVLPELFNLAWAPAVDVDRVDIYDRHNGVPTLGIFTVRSEAHLFWRVFGYTGDHSGWLYVPLTAEEGDAAARGDDLGLDGIVYGLAQPRYATIGAAEANRIVFEREWQIPAGMTPHTLLRPYLVFLLEALEVASTSGLPPTRREAVERTHEAVRELVPAR